MKEKVVRNKWKAFVLSIFSVYSACLIVFYDSFHFCGSVFGSIEYNYVQIDGLVIRLIFIPICTVVCGLLTLCICRVYEKLGNKLFVQNMWTKRKKLFFFLGIVTSLILCWSPYILTYYPGAVYSDGFVSIDQILKNYLNNHHPIFYTKFVGLFIRFGLHFGSLNMGIALYTLGQTVIMALVLAYTLLWMHNKNINKLYIILCGLFFAFYPLFPYYAIALWKDTLFSLVLFLFILLQIDVVVSKGMLLNTVKGLVHYSILAIGVMFLRNNGIYIIAFSIVIHLLINFRMLKTLKKFVICAAVMMTATFIIQNPVYESMDLSTEFVENLGIPMQQISAVAAYDGELTQEQEDFLGQIWDLEELGKKYTPCLADTPKGRVDKFNGEFIENHKKEFLKTWIQVCIQNPKIVTDAFFMENLGFWHLSVSGKVAYIQPGVWENSFGVERKDLFEKFFHFSFEKLVLPRHYLSCGFLFWLVLLNMTVMVILRGERSITIWSSVIGAWITMMIATPIAISLRYMYILVLVLPLLPITPFFECEDSSE
ncbi:hypothetical protein IMSAGC018_02303 [Lachnospiraceae bacterium]|nr:hypothetical protein IMSAGC018_02303 [Lachnospiraceae bacterium]